MREDLADLEPYGAPQLDVPVRLNVNETATPPPASYLAAVTARIAELELHRYPDREATTLRRLLGAPYGLGVDRVWAANGSNEILAQVFQAYGGPGRVALTTRPGYSMYPDLARVSGTGFVEVDLGEDFVLTAELAAAAVADHDPDLVVLASPNNPTGVPVAHDVVRRLHDDSRALVVVDEAYVEFGGESCVGLLDELPRLVVVRTFSKAFAMAGLRFGYLLGHDWVVHDLRRVRLPYHLDAMKQVAVEVAAADPTPFLAHRELVASERARIVAALDELGLVQWPSVANFVLFRTDVADLFDQLLARGVLIRDFSTKPGLAGCVRVSVGTPDENDAFLAALREVLAGAG